MSKAYDRLEWAFVAKVLKAFGFDDWFCGLIMECISTVTFQILVNGGLTKSFKPERGLRQGDPLSPYLFIICSEILSRLISEKERQGMITGYRVSSNDPLVSHLMYVDDTIFFTRADITEVDTLQDTLNLYCSWSGQRINVNKSKIFLSKNCESNLGIALSDFLGFDIMEGDEFFLGNPLFVSGNRAKDFHFIIDKVRNRMEGWRAKLLSQMARTVLIKNVISAIPIYSMSIFLLPKSITDALDALVRLFWWTGLGIRKFNDINFCLIAKLGWQLAKNGNSLWCQIMLGKYGHQGSFWGRNLPRIAFGVARGIWKTKDFIKDNSIWIIGGNSRVKLWQGSWSCADGVCINPCDLNPGVVNDITVGNLISDGEPSWNISLIERLCQPEASNKILSSYISILPDRDSLMWKSSPSGEFILKNAYWDLHFDDFSLDKDCRLLWKLPIHDNSSFGNASKGVSRLALGWESFLGISLVNVSCVM
uniref:Reverse transcriptase domain-containing protein n=1 Tax=Cannabis sativa TaxID=3483 RepID=A0A803PEA1_CANSA